MPESKTDPKLWATITIVVSVIACIGTVSSALLGALPELLKITTTQTASNYQPSPYPVVTNTPFVSITATIANFTSTPEVTVTPSAYIYYEKAESCYLNSDFDCTISFCTQAINLKSDFANAYFKRGDAYDETGKYDLAIIDYTKAIDLHYEPLQTVYHYRGTTYLKMKEYSLALSDFNVSISIKPSAVSYTNRGEVYFRLKDYEKALADANEAIKINPSLSGAYLVRGTVYRDMGLTEQAIADFKMIITLNNNNSTEVLAEQRLINMGVPLP